MAPIHKNYWVYFMTNHPHGTLYIGVTNSLQRRIWPHRTGMKAGFTTRYGLKELVYFEAFRDVRNALARETKLKGWSRRRKIELIENENPLWTDLAADWFAGVSLDYSFHSG
ncbi:MAG: GIY-YIG nuclease family protein [Opitutaceae bacterium]